MSRWFYTPFIVLAATLGLAYVFGDPSRTAAQSFHAAQSLAPMWAWGTLFFAGAVAILAAVLSNRDKLIAASLFIGGVMYSWWAVLFAVSALTDETASLAGWAVHGFVSATHYVTAWRVWVQT